MNFKKHHEDGFFSDKRTSDIWEKKFSSLEEAIKKREEAWELINEFQIEPVRNYFQFMGKKYMTEEHQNGLRRLYVWTEAEIPLEKRI
jgi:hypothetical protein